MGIRDLFRRATEKLAYLLNFSGYKVRDKEIGRKDWVLQGFWADVDSSWVLRIRYIDEDKFLDVQFDSGAICRYEGIQLETALKMFNAPSLGKFVHQYLKPLPYTRLA